MEDNAILANYYESTEEGLDSDDIQDIIEDKFSYDEDLDDEKDIRKIKLAKKRELSKAKKYLNDFKEKYFLIDKELIYILDTANERVKVYDANGNYKFRWGGPFAYNTLVVWYSWFPFDGWFADPKAITADDLGNIYVGDSGNKRVQVFDADGNHITSFGGTGEDEFSYIAGMDFSSDGSLYIVDESRKVVQKWQYQPNL